MVKEKLELIRRHSRDSRMTPERKKEVGKLLDDLETELAALPEFQDCYVDCLTFEEDTE